MFCSTVGQYGEVCGAYKGKGIMTVAPCVTLDRLNSRIAAIEEYFDSSKARRLLPLVKKTGWHKGEIKDLTPLQFRRVLGYAPRKSVIVKGKVPWEYCFDQLAAEFGYSSDEDLKRELEHIARKKKELDKLKAEASGLNRDVKLRSREKTAVRFKNIKVSHNGLIGGKEILVGGKRVGVLVQNPSTWSVHITDDHKISKRALESPLAETRFLSQAEKEARKIFEITGPTLRKRKRKTKKRKKGGS